jgi:hypothetical protein
MGVVYSFLSFPIEITLLLRFLSNRPTEDMRKVFTNAHRSFSQRFCCGESALSVSLSSPLSTLSLRLFFWTIAERGFHESPCRFHAVMHRTKRFLTDGIKRRRTTMLPSTVSIVGSATTEQRLTQMAATKTQTRENALIASRRQLRRKRGKVTTRGEMASFTGILLVSFGTHLSRSRNGRVKRKPLT